MYDVIIEHIGYEKDRYSEELINELVAKGICIINKDKIKFIATGILIYKNKFIIIFPKAYSLPEFEKSILKHIRVLFKVLLKYRQEVNLNTEEVELLGGDNGNQKENLLIAHRLINDFIHNGLLIKEIRSKSILSGKVDWPATINEEQPIFSGRNVIYTETVSRKTKVDRKNQIFLLHKYCVYKSIERYGWLLGITVESVNLDQSEIECDISYALNLLTNELNSTFVEREINVIKLMMQFLLGLEEQKGKETLETLVTPYFYNVWEYICSVNFNNQYNTLKNIIPKLKWEIESDAMVQNQRPDIMLIKEKKLYILDAKYYNIDTNLPGWPDVVKQLFYSFTIFKNIKSEKFSAPNKKIEYQLKTLENVENVFLFPSGDSEPIKYVGKVKIENNSDLEDIKAYKINTFIAMKCFIKAEKYNFVNGLSVL